jgi:HJR/Mrr/RecB family endonuclease
MAIHPHYKESSFDELLNTLLVRKRDLSTLMLLPPVDSKADQNWFADNLGRGPAAYVHDEIDIDEIDCMEPTAFERWALTRCIPLGWEASRTPGSYDGGADGILVHRSSGAQAIVQCKHKQGRDKVCGTDAIDDLLRARECYAGTTSRLIVLSNAERFSQAARDSAQRYGIDLISRQELPDWPRQLMS